MKQTMYRFYKGTIFVCVYRFFCSLTWWVVYGSKSNHRNLKLSLATYNYFIRCGKFLKKNFDFIFRGIYKYLEILSVLDFFRRKLLKECWKYYDFEALEALKQSSV